MLCHHAMRCSFQYSSHFGPSPGGTKYSHSICSNSQERKMKCSTVTSLRKLLPIWAMPNGIFMLVLCCTFMNCTNIACAVSGRRYTELAASAASTLPRSSRSFSPSASASRTRPTTSPIGSTGPRLVRNIRLKRRSSLMNGEPQFGHT
jgi:hypothetical protein